ncbi:MAG: sulfite reductase (NADPH) hemoprotein beta-component [Thiomicrorhabdus sp.]|nr:MAG: sulfite reductase (NADPH) hemoprotein beta-component [Thiomicrorhabdus sp.]
MINKIEVPIAKILNQLADNDSDIEILKDNSNFLRGSLVEGFADPLTGAIHEDDIQMIKYHGSYQQDDRDVRNARVAKKLEPAYSFMIRVRLPGGHLTAQQWLACDEISRTYGNGTIKLSTRQAVQFHGIIKFDMKKTIQAMDKALLDSVATCGDINRNVMCIQDPSLSTIHDQVFPYADAIADRLLPSTRAYHEIWLDDDHDKKLVAGGGQIIEPIYGKHYLPRKFKIAIAIPPYNDVDVYINDIGIIAVEEKGQLVGFNISIGGGLAHTFGREDTFPRLGDTIGFCPSEQIVDVAQHIMCVQRDFGNRNDRKLSRFKHTVEKYGTEWFIEELNSRLEKPLEAVRETQFTTSSDRYGWHQSKDGLWHLLLFIEGGRITNLENYAQKDILAEIAKLDVCDFRLTGNQNMQLIGITKANKAKVEALVKNFDQSTDASHLTGMERNAIACVALNTCSLAMAEAERYLPSLLTKITPILEKNGLENDDIKIRMTGCPNGCGRSIMGEIGFIGKLPGKYNMYLGGDYEGYRLSKLYKENLTEEQILAELDPLLTQYAQGRKDGEYFGDFVIRQNIVKASKGGLAFHEGV